MSSSFTATDVQKAKLEKLMQNIDKPIEIPSRPKDSKFAEPPDFIRNIMGSSAGAGSGEFHVYRHLRRKEYARQRFIEDQAKQEELDRKFKEAVEEKKRKVEEKTAKKRAKRLRKKEKMKQARKAKKINRGQAKETTEEDTDDDESDEEEDRKSYTDLTSKTEVIGENKNKSQKEIENNVKTELDENTGSKPISNKVIKSKTEDSESSDEEIIGPMPQVSKNNEDPTSEADNEKHHFSDKETNPKSKPKAVENQNLKSEYPSNESDDGEVIGPMPVSTDKGKEKDEDKDEDESSDDEIIGPMPV